MYILFDLIKQKIISFNIQEKLRQRKQSSHCLLSQYVCLVFSNQFNIIRK